jgi:hypothetical protein
MNDLMFQVGSLGILRVSRRCIDSPRSIHENYPFRPHDRDDFLVPGEVVKMEIGIWAMGGWSMRLGRALELRFMG